MTADIVALSGYRDRAIHVDNAYGLGAVIHPLCSRNVLNYRDFMVAKSRKGLADIGDVAAAAARGDSSQPMPSSS